MRGSNRALVVLSVLVSVALLGIGVWRIIRAFQGSSSSSRTIFIPSAAPDPACANPANTSTLCINNPCNPTSVYYRPTDPGCQSIGGPPSSGAGSSNIPTVPGGTGPP